MAAPPSHAAISSGTTSGSCEKSQSISSTNSAPAASARSKAATYARPSPPLRSRCSTCTHGRSPARLRGAYARLVAGAPPTNDAIAGQLELLADLSEILGEDGFRVRAYRTAAARVRESGMSVGQRAPRGGAAE